MEYVQLTANEKKNTKNTLKAMESASKTAREKCGAIVEMLSEKGVPFSQATLTLANMYSDWPKKEDGSLYGASTMRKSTAPEELQDYTSKQSYKLINAFETMFRRLYTKGEDNSIILKPKGTKQATGSTSGTPASKKQVAFLASAKKEEMEKMEPEDQKATILNDLKIIAEIMEVAGVDEEAIKAVRSALGYLV